MHMPSGTISYFQYRQTFLQARRLPALALSAWVVKVLITMRVKQLGIAAMGHDVVTLPRPLGI